MASKTLLKTECKVHNNGTVDGFTKFVLVPARKDCYCNSMTVLFDETTPQAERLAEYASRGATIEIKLMVSYG